jgi:tetratricopeptide (TPR) repeat protein
VILAFDVHGFIVPGENGNLGGFDHDVRYRFNIENTGDAMPDKTGDAQLELGNYTEARAVYAKLAEDSATPPILARQSRLAELTGDNQKAIKLLSHATKDGVWFRVRLGELYFRTGDLEKAEVQYQAALQQMPDSFLVLEHLAELRAAQTRYNEAIALYQKVIARVPVLNSSRRWATSTHSWANPMMPNHGTNAHWLRTRNHRTKQRALPASSGRFLQRCSGESRRGSVLDAQGFGSASQHLRLRLAGVGVL